MENREAQHRLESAKNFCETFGMSGEAIKPIRLRYNSLFLVQDVGVVLRVHNARTTCEEVRREIEVAQHLAANGVPTPAILYGHDQIFWSGKHFVTAWEYLEASHAPECPEAEFGLLINDFHAAMESFQNPLPCFDPLGNARRRLSRLQIEPSSLEFLTIAVDDCTQRLRQVKSDEANQSVHGDAHTGNVIWHSGKGFLIDFEAVAKGSIGVDIAPMVVIQRRFRRDLDLARFVAAAAPGFRLTDLDPALVRARELSMLTWLGQSVEASPKLAAEFDLRLSTLRNQDVFAAWNPQ